MAKIGTAEKLSSDIADIVEEVYEVGESMLQAKVRSYSRKIAGYEKKAQAYDIMCRYLRNGTTRVSDTDREKVDSAYAKKLQQVVNFNKRLKKAKDDAKRIPGLKKQVSALTREKSRLQTQYDNLRSSYEQKTRDLRKKYAKAEFTQKRIRELREMSYEQFEEQMKDENAFLKTTHYGPEGKERKTDATDVLSDYISIYKAKKKIEEMSARHRKRIDTILAGKNPDSGPDKKPKKPKKPAKKG